MVLLKRTTAHHKRHSPKKQTKKYNLKGGALTQKQIDLLRMISKIITWGSLGLISICTAMPLIQVITGLLASAGLDAMTAAFYELIWVNLSSTMASIYSASSAVSSASLASLSVLARAGNLCAVVHATTRLANPIYSFALGGIESFVHIMKNPLNFNQTVNRFLREQNGIIDNFLGDYAAVGRHARAGIQATVAVERELYEKMRMFMGQLEVEIEAALPHQSAEEKAALAANKQWLSNCENFIFSILSNAVEGVNYSTAKYAAHKGRVSACARGAMGVAKEWISYFKKCATNNVGNTEQYINKRKRSHSPSPRHSPNHSPPPSPREMVDLATIMLIPSEEEASQYEDAFESLPASIIPNAEVNGMLGRISPRPAQISAMVREFNACSRGASAPPMDERPILRGRRRYSSVGPIGQLPSHRRGEFQHLDPIAASPEEKHSSKKVKKEGGNHIPSKEKEKSNPKPNSNKKNGAPKQEGGRKTRKRKY